MSDQKMTAAELRQRAAQSRQDALYYRKRPEPLTEECADALDIAAGAREKLADALDQLAALQARCEQREAEMTRAIQGNALAATSLAEKLAAAEGEIQRLTARASREQATACPFCGDRDFDAVGLKVHLNAGYCEAFNELKIGNRVY